MGYEDAPATRLVATNCCCCQRPLVDAQSVELGIGPVCRAKNGYDQVTALPGEARVEANKLINICAAKREGEEVLAAVKRLFELGAIGVVTAILKRLATVQIATTEEGHPHGAGRFAVKAPYCEAALQDFRNIPGSRWDKENKVRTYPFSSRGALFGVLKKWFGGCTAMGPKGPFILPLDEVQEQAPTALRLMQGGVA